MLRTHIGRLRLIGFMEGVSLLVILFVTMPLKYFFDFPEANQFFGMLHGVLFLVYVFNVLLVKFRYGWPIGKTSLALLASIVPFGTFWADVRLFRTQRIGPSDKQGTLL